MRVHCARELMIGTVSTLTLPSYAYLWGVEAILSAFALAIIAAFGRRYEKVKAL